MLALLLVTALSTSSTPAAELAALGVAQEGGSGKVSLDLKSADVRQVVRVLGETGRYNVVVADDVQGRVTLRMRGVPWKRALRAVLEAGGLEMEVEGNVIFVDHAGRPR